MSTNLTGKELQAAAKDRGIKGRSKMTADELRQAIIEADTLANTQDRADQTGMERESPMEAAEKSYSYTVTAKDELGNPMDVAWESNDDAVTIYGEYGPVSPERESPMEQEFFAKHPELPVVSVEAETWTVVPNREERRKAARRQRKAAGRIAAKNQNN